MVVTPICNFCAKTGVLCIKCKQKLRNGKITEVEVTVSKAFAKAEQKYPKLLQNVTLDRVFAEDLVDTKLRLIREHIDKILTAWNYSSADKFIADARKGVIEEAEMDAIGLTNLLDRREELFKIKNSWIDVNAKV